MNPHKHNISFSPESHTTVSFDDGAILSEHLTIENSPVLFGCRTAVCGTCLIEVLAEENGCLASPADDEKELLEIIAPENPRARLACQLTLSADIRIRYLGKA
ncbi:MAG: 2Fe-2S iron-sulfur cluster-binding protein [Acidobacteriota bacterium]